MAHIFAILLLIISSNLSAEVSQGQITPTNKVEYNPESPHKVGIGKIMINTSDDIQYQFMYKDAPISLWPAFKLRGGPNVLGSFDASARTLLPSGDNLIDTGSPTSLGSLLDKDRKLVLLPPDPTQYVTVTISYQRTLDDQGRMVVDRTNIVSYNPVGNIYFVLTFDNKLFLNRLKGTGGDKTILENALIKQAADAQEKGDQTLMRSLLQKLTTVRSLATTAWDLDQYVLNISFNAYGNTVHTDNPNIYHPVDIDSIDVSCRVIKSDRIDTLVVTIPHDILYKESTLINAYTTSTLPAGIPGKISTTAESTAQTFRKK